MLYASGNRDEDAFGPTADRLDVLRPTSPANVAFGFGEHNCLGAPLARLEAPPRLRRTPAPLPQLRGDRASRHGGLNPRARRVRNESDPELSDARARLRNQAAALRRSARREPHWCRTWRSHAVRAQRDRRRDAAAPGLVRHQAAAHRYLRVGLEADPPRLRGRHGFGDERAVLVPASDGPRSRGHHHRGRAGGRRLRCRPTRHPQPVAFVRATRHQPAVSELRDRRLLVVLELLARRVSPTASTPACRATPPVATPS